MKLNYYMPAEWTQHSGTLLAWPHNRETWPGERLQRVIRVYIDFIEALLESELVVCLLSDTKMIEQVPESIRKHKHFMALNLENNDVWARDFGPIVVKARDSADFVFSNWGYNAWGEKYPPFDADDAVPGKLAQLLGMNMLSTKMILEGGSIETNGAGTLLTTKSVLLHANRNPSMTQAQIERKLAEILGATEIIWLDKGLEGDDTDGHIDDLTRFVNEKILFTSISHDASDPNYETLLNNMVRLTKTIAEKELPFSVVELPLPYTKIEGTTVDGSEYVPASYANFYIANSVVCVPLYDPNYDEAVLELFKKYFPSRDVRGISCADLVWGQGSLHCITQQLYGDLSPLNEHLIS